MVMPPQKRKEQGRRLPSVSQREKVQRHHRRDRGRGAGDRHAPCGEESRPQELSAAPRRDSQLLRPEA